MCVAPSPYKTCADVIGKKHCCTIFYRKIGVPNLTCLDTLLALEAKAYV